jgi:hypothetical protein
LSKIVPPSVFENEVRFKTRPEPSAEESMLPRK